MFQKCYKLQTPLATNDIEIMENARLFIDEPCPPNHSTVPPHLPENESYTYSTQALELDTP